MSNIYSATSEPSGLFTGLQNTPLVRYEEILVATDNFAAENILGRGGYGVVYKGSWKHTQVCFYFSTNQVLWTCL